MQIQSPHQVQEQPRRFYDGGLPPDGARPGVPPDPDSDPRIVLERISRAGLEEFAMQRRIAYRDRHLGELLVPADVAAAVLGAFPVSLDEARDLRHGKRLTGAASRLASAPAAAIDPHGALVGVVERRGDDVKSVMNLPEEASR